MRTPKPVPVYLGAPRNPYFAEATPQFLLWSTENTGELSLESLTDSTNTVVTLPDQNALPERLIASKSTSDDCTIVVAHTTGYASFTVPKADLDELSSNPCASPLDISDLPEVRKPDTEIIELESGPCRVEVHDRALILYGKEGQAQEITLPGSAYALGATLADSMVQIVISTANGIYQVSLNAADIFDFEDLSETSSKGSSEKAMQSERTSVISEGSEPPLVAAVAARAKVDVPSNPEGPSYYYNSAQNALLDSLNEVKANKKASPEPQPKSKPKSKSPAAPQQGSSTPTTYLEHRIQKLEERVSELEHLSVPRDVASAVELVMAGERPLAWLEDHTDDVDTYISQAKPHTAQLVRLVLIEAFPGSRFADRLKSSLGGSIVDPVIYNKLK